MKLLIPLADLFEKLLVVGVLPDRQAPLGELLDQQILLLSLLLRIGKRGLRPDQSRRTLIRGGLGLDRRRLLNHPTTSHASQP